MNLRFISILSLLLLSHPVAAEAAAGGILVETFATVLYSLIGIAMLVLGFKVVDWLTPGNLADEIVHKENIALSIVVSTTILGICLIIASVLLA